jgi:adenylate cyclase
LGWKLTGSIRRHFRLNLLGRPSFIIGDQAVSLPGRRMLLLLAYLALQPDGEARRDDAATLLWGDRDDQMARQNLRQLLMRLNTALGAEHASLVTADREMIRLNIASIDIDVLQFRHLARRSVNGDLGHAAALYHGSFLAGVSLEAEEANAWIEAERAQLTTQAAGVYERLAKIMDAEGRGAEALDYARKLVQIDPFEEAAQRLLIRLMARHEGSSSALGYAQSIEKLFRKELDIGLERETVALLADVRADSTADQPDVRPVPGIAGPSPPVEEAPSIAVLPFADLGGEQHLSFVAEGLAEEITNGLSRLRWLLVIARTATLAFSDSKLDTRRIAADLGVRYLVTGSIRASADRIRLHVQLIEARSGIQIWGQRYDRPLGDIFDLQDEVTEHVVATIEPALYAQEGFKSAKQLTRNLGSWERVVQAIGLIHRFERGPNEQARALLEQALALEPDYARARAILAWALFWAQQCFWVQDREDAAQAARMHAETAMRQDQGEPWARMVFGFLLSQNGNHQRGIQELETALRLNPNFALGRMLLGWAHVRAGNFDSGVTETAKALRLSPADNFASVYQATHGLALLSAQRFEEALPHLRASVSPHTEYMGHYNALISCCGHLGLVDEARRLLDYRYSRLNKHMTLANAGRMLVGFAHRDVFMEGLRKAGVTDPVEMTFDAMAANQQSATGSLLVP